MALRQFVDRYHVNAVPIVHPSSAVSVVKVLVVEQTKTQDPAWGDLYGAIDIWCPLFPLHDPETAAQRMALGEDGVEPHRLVPGETDALVAQRLSPST
jgi:hypothetical protein